MSRLLATTARTGTAFTCMANELLTSKTEWSYCSTFDARDRRIFSATSQVSRKAISASYRRSAFRCPSAMKRLAASGPARQPD